MRNILLTLCAVVALLLPACTTEDVDKNVTSTSGNFPMSADEQQASLETIIKAYDAQDYVTIIVEVESGDELIGYEVTLAENGLVLLPADDDSLFTSIEDGDRYLTIESADGYTYQLAKVAEISTTNTQVDGVTYSSGTITLEVSGDCVALSAEYVEGIVVARSVTGVTVEQDEESIFVTLTGAATGDEGIVKVTAVMSNGTEISKSFAFKVAIAVVIDSDTNISEAIADTIAEAIANGSNQETVISVADGVDLGTINIDASTFNGLSDTITLNLEGYDGDVTFNNTATEDTTGNFVFYAPDATVTLTGANFATVVATTQPNTLIVGENTTIGTIDIMAGNVEIYGSVGTITVNAANTSAGTITVYNGATLGTATSIGIYTVEYIVIGSGTKDDPYQISTPTQLAAMGSGAFAVNDNTYFQLTETIDMDGIAFSPIKKSGATTLSGLMFDGNNNTIKNLSITTTSEYTGLFYALNESSEIKNLTLENPIISARSNTGAITGYLQGGSTIDNCHVIGNNASITTTSSSGVGGIVGSMFISTIKNCSNSATVTSTYSSSSSSAASKVGGIVGTVSNSGASSITGCSNSGTISGNEMYVGGIVGYLLGWTTALQVVEDCENTGRVSSETANCGGIVGYVTYTTISDCENSGAISGQSYCIGGIVGQGSNLDIDDCTNNGGSVTMNNGTASYSLVGGIAGKLADSTVDGCSNSGTITGAMSYNGGILGESSATPINDCENSGSVNGSADNTGGIAGFANAQISNCENSGTIIGGGSNFHTGGVVGCYAATVNIYKCENSGNVTGGNSTGGVAGGVYVGGVSECENSGTIKGLREVGGISGSVIDENSIGTIKVYDSHNSGTVLSTLTSETQASMGGIVGLLTDSKIEYCSNSGTIGDIYSGYVGGVAGYPTTYLGSSDITASYNTGELIGYSTVGGVSACLFGDSTMSACYNTGKITCKSNTAGVVALNKGTITSCYSTGAIYQTAEAGVVFFAAYGINTNESAAVLSEVYVVDVEGDDIAASANTIYSNSATSYSIEMVTDLNDKISSMNEKITGYKFVEGSSTPTLEKN